MKMDASQCVSEQAAAVVDGHIQHSVNSSCSKPLEVDTASTAELMLDVADCCKFESNISPILQGVDHFPRDDFISESFKTSSEIQLEVDKHQDEKVSDFNLNELPIQITESNHCESEVLFETQGVDEYQMDMEALENEQTTIDVLIDDNEHEEDKVSCFNLNKLPIQITGAWKAYENALHNNFTKGCKWAPDGSCLLTCSDDNKLRLFNLPASLWQENLNWEEMSEMEAALSVSESELVYDYCWYPRMSSLDPVSCCFLSSSRRSPVHMWDAFTGDLRCTYRSYNHVDEIVAPHSLAFDADGEKIYCGFKNMVRIFEVSVPGRKFISRPTCDKRCGQGGIISCFAFNRANKSLSAAGSYSKTVGIYSEPDGMLIHLLSEQQSGVTHLSFSPDGNKLYSGGRKDPEILCWDVRNLGTVLYALPRKCTTNQRLYFDISSCGKYIVSGNQNGVVTIWDSSKSPIEITGSERKILEPMQFYQGHHDCVNGVSFHPNMPLLATSSGQRKFPEPVDSDEETNKSDEMFSYNNVVKDNSLRIWCFYNEGD